MWLIGMDQVVGDLPFKLTVGSHIVGRSKKCDLTILHPTLSRQHIRIWVNEPNQATVKDLESKNGTFVNDVRITQQPVKPKSILRLGDIRIFLSAEEPSEALLDSFEETQSAKRDRARPLTNLPVESLTAAQWKVFELLVAGEDEPTIAARLHRSFHTIHVHVQAIFRKLGAHTRSELLAMVIQSQQTLPGRERPNSLNRRP